MSDVLIRKAAAGDTAMPIMPDYTLERAAFSWDTAAKELDGLPDGKGLNIAHEAVDRHARGARASQVALRWLDREGLAYDFTYLELSRLSNQFANVLESLGVEKGDRVFALTSRIPELYISALGTLKAGCVFSPLFSSFGPEPIRVRLDMGKGKVLVTTRRLYCQKVRPIRSELSHLAHVLLVDHDGDTLDGAETASLLERLAVADERFTIAATAPEDPALLHFTSGTTGNPKGAVHVHQAVLSHHVSARYALDLRPTDVFWCTADPGWVTGISYGLIAPLTNGATLLVDREEFDPERWLDNLARHKVNVWYTAPTAVRMMMKRLGTRRCHNLRHLRLIASVGEPLNPEAVLWGQENFGLPLHDNWWQTETGAIMIANFAASDIKPGSMGRPLPGVEAAVLRREADGSLDSTTEPDAVGELALRTPWPSMFRGYLNDERRYRACFEDGWYLTGDLARRDEDGYFWFVARADDIITSSGHRIGPFEVESVLMEHAAVAETGVIGTPDPIATELVKAFVTLKAGHAPSEAVRRDILSHARRRLGATVAPKVIEFREKLPKTRSGKIMRRVLRNEERTDGK